MNRTRHHPRFELSGFTLIEISIVVVIMAVIAAAILPVFLDYTNGTRSEVARFNHKVLQSQIDFYRLDHDGNVPSGEMQQLTVSTNAQGDSGSGTAFPYGPYIPQVPENSLNNSNSVTVISNSPAQSGDVTEAGGWLYNDQTGEIWIDHSDHYQE